MSEPFDLSRYIDFSGYPSTPESIEFIQALINVASTPEGQDLITAAYENQGEQKIALLYDSSSGSHARTFDFPFINKALNVFSPSVTFSHSTFKYYSPNHGGNVFSNDMLVFEFAAEQTVFHEFFHMADPISNLGKNMDWGSVYEELYVKNLHNTFNENAPPSMRHIKDTVHYAINRGWITDEDVWNVATKLYDQTPIEKRAIEGTNAFGTKYLNYEPRTLHLGEEGTNVISQNPRGNRKAYFEMPFHENPLPVTGLPAKLASYANIHRVMHDKSFTEAVPLSGENVVFYQDPVNNMNASISVSEPQDPIPTAPPNYSFGLSESSNER